MGSSSVQAPHPRNPQLLQNLLPPLLLHVRVFACMHTHTHACSGECTHLHTRTRACVLSISQEI